MTVYCNITECTNWLPLSEPHKMEHPPGFVPIGKTDEYTGRCAFESIKIESTTARGHSTKQTLAICGNYNSAESSEFSCEEERCKYYVEGGTCDKVKNGRNLYIDWTIAFNGNDKTRVPRCKVFAHRWRENAFDWGRAAVPGM